MTEPALPVLAGEYPGNPLRVGAAVVQACLERNLLVNATQGRVIRLLPAMTISAADVDEGCDRLCAAITEVAGRS